MLVVYSVDDFTAEALDGPSALPPVSANKHFDSNASEGDDFTKRKSARRHRLAHPPRAPGGFTSVVQRTRAEAGPLGPAVAERVRRMEAADVILGYRLAVGLETIFPITAIVRVSAPESNCTALSARTRELVEVIEAYRVTGDDRLVLKVVARSVPHLDWVIAALGRYGTPTVSIVLKARSRPVQRAPEPARPVRPAVATPKTSANRPPTTVNPALSGRRLRRSDLRH